MAACSWKVCATLFLCLTCISAQQPPLFPALFIFGDSLVDVGNNNYIATLARADLEPNGVDFPTHEATGRFCNGKTVMDVLVSGEKKLLALIRDFEKLTYLERKDLWNGSIIDGEAARNSLWHVIMTQNSVVAADYIGLPYPPPYLAPSTTGIKILRGVNYASGAGGILDGTGANYIERLSLSTQLQYFQRTVAEVNVLLGATRTQNLLRNSLFPIVMGSNDFLNNYLLSNSKSRSVYTPPQYIQIVLSTYKEQLMRLYRSGARKFFVSSVGPLGCVPSRLAIGSTDGSCIPSINELVVNFNSDLQAMLLNLTNSLPGAMFLYGNSFDAFYSYIRDPSPFGFTVTNRGCCGLGKYKGQLPCLPIVGGLCPHRNSYIFWDPYHPTQAINELIGRRFFHGPPSDVYPMNVYQLSQIQV